MKTTGEAHAVIAIDTGELSAEPDSFLLDEFLPYELSVTAARTARLFARHYEARFGLSIAEWRVLVVVGRYGTITPSAVAERTDMDKVKVSRATASLVGAGLLEQSPAPHDGRARLLRLTSKGAGVHQEILPLSRSLEAQMAEGLSEDEWRSLRHCLRRLQQHLGKLDDRVLPMAATHRVFGDGPQAAED